MGPLFEPAPRRELEDPMKRAADLAAQLTPNQRRAMMRLVEQRMAAEPTEGELGEREAEGAGSEGSLESSNPSAEEAPRPSGPVR
jgi:hypothetical protein